MVSLPTTKIQLLLTYISLYTAHTVPYKPLKLFIGVLALPTTFKPPNLLF